MKNIHRVAGRHLITACGHFAAAAADTAGFRVLRRQKYISAYLQQMRKRRRVCRVVTPERGVGGGGVTGGRVRCCGRRSESLTKWRVWGCDERQLRQKPQPHLHRLFLLDFPPWCFQYVLATRTRFCCRLQRRRRRRRQKRFARAPKLPLAAYLILRTAFW